MALALLIFTSVGKYLVSDEASGVDTGSRGADANTPLDEAHLDLLSER